MSLTYLYVIITSALSVVVTFGSLKRVQCRTKNRQKVTFFPHQYLSKRNNKWWFVSQREKADSSRECSKFYYFVKTREGLKLRKKDILLHFFLFLESSVLWDLSFYFPPFLTSRYIFSFFGLRSNPDWLPNKKLPKLLFLTRLISW